MKALLAASPYAIVPQRPSSPQALYRRHRAETLDTQKSGERMKVLLVTFLSRKVTSAD
jgi:hypothetical protein